MISRQQTMFRVAVLRRLNNPLDFAEVEIPSQLLPGQVLVRVLRSGICASQVHEIKGRKGNDPYLPHALGHEGVGEVVDFGPGVSRFKKGQLVVMHWRESKGMSVAGSSYSDKSGNKINIGPITTLSEYSLVSENRLTLLPKGFPLDYAPLLGCALLTGFGAVTREANVRPGESCLILGLGGVGISVLKTLKLLSACPITVVEISSEKLQLAERLGADVTILVDPNENNLGSLLSQRGVSSPDVVFECTGQRSLIEQTISVVSPHGRVLLIGVPDVNNPSSIHTLPLHLGISLLGSHGGASEPHIDIPKISKLVDSGYLSLDDYPLEKFGFEDLNNAMAKLEQGVLGRVIVHMS